MMNRMISMHKDSAAQLKNPRTAAICAMLMALQIVLNLFRLDITETLRVSFSFICTATAGLLFGPVVGLLYGFAADIFGFFVKPGGPFFFGFTLNAMLGGWIYGMFLFRRPPTLLRCGICKGVINLVVNITLNTLWNSVLYGTAFWVLLPARAGKNLLMLAVEIPLLYVVLKAGYIAYGSLRGGANHKA